MSLCDYCGCASPAPVHSHISSISVNACSVHSHILRSTHFPLSPITALEPTHPPLASASLEAVLATAHSGSVPLITCLQSFEWKKEKTKYFTAEEKEGETDHWEATVEYWNQGFAMLRKCISTALSTVSKIEKSPESHRVIRGNFKRSVLIASGMRLLGIMLLQKGCVKESEECFQQASDMCGHTEPASGLRQCYLRPKKHIDKQICTETALNLSQKAGEVRQSIEDMFQFWNANRKITKYLCEIQRYSDVLSTQIADSRIRSVVVRALATLGAGLEIRWCQKDVEAFFCLALTLLRDGVFIRPSLKHEERDSEGSEGRTEVMCIVTKYSSIKKRVRLTRKEERVLWQVLRIEDSEKFIYSIVSKLADHYVESSKVKKMEYLHRFVSHKNDTIAEHAALQLAKLYASERVQRFEDAELLLRRLLASDSRAYKMLAKLLALQYTLNCKRTLQQYGLPTEPIPKSSSLTSLLCYLEEFEDNQKLNARMELLSSDAIAKLDSRSDSKLLQALLILGKHFYRTENYSDAEKCFDAGRKYTDIPELVVKFVLRLGKVYVKLDRQQEIETLFASFDRTASPSAKIAKLYKRLGRLRRIENRLGEAEQSYVISLAMLQSGKESSYSYANVLCELAELFVLTNRISSAKEMYEQVLTLLTQIPPSTRKVTASVEKAKLTLERVKEYIQSEVVLELALKAFESDRRVASFCEPLLTFKCSDKRVATRLFERAVELHPSFRLLITLGDLYKSQNRDYLPLFTQALEMVTDADQLVEITQKLCSAYFPSQHYLQLSRTLEKSYEVMQRMAPGSSQEAELMLLGGEVWLEAQKHEAVRCLRCAYEIRRRLGLDLSKVFSMLCSAYRSEFEIELEESLLLDHVSTLKPHELVVYWDQVALFYKFYGIFEKAEECYRTAQLVCSQHGSSSEAFGLVTQIGKFYMSIGKRSAAVPLYEAALRHLLPSSSTVSAFPLKPNSDCTSDLASHYATDAIVSQSVSVIEVFLQSETRYKDIEAMYKGILTVVESKRPAAGLSDVLHALGGFYEQQGRVREAKHCFERIIALLPTDTSATRSAWERVEQLAAFYYAHAFDPETEALCSRTLLQAGARREQHLFEQETMSVGVPRVLVPKHSQARAGDVLLPASPCSAGFGTSYSFVCAILLNLSAPLVGIESV